MTFIIATSSPLPDRDRRQDFRNLQRAQPLVRATVKGETTRATPGRCWDLAPASYVAIFVPRHYSSLTTYHKQLFHSARGERRSGVSRT